MLNKHKLYKMALVSATMILMLGNIVGAKPYNYDDRTCGCGVTLITDPCTQSVDYLHFPIGGCDGGCGVTLITDPCAQSVDLLKFPAC
jgi:hypothetical protein